MSAFFVAINRDFSGFDDEIAERMMSSIERFGHDAQTLIVQGHFAIGYQSRWNVPEEVGEHQPLCNVELGQWFVFHGRVDNRDELFHTLGESPTKSLSDAALIWRFFTKHGVLALSDIIGPFVFVVIEPSLNKVIAARDGMGGRYLCYRITEQFILISSYEMAIVEHGSVSYRLNDAKVARTLVNEMESSPTSTIEGISTLMPGEKLIVDLQGERRARFYRYSAKKRIRFRTNQEYALEFRRLLQQAVKRRMRSTGTVATMLSGGLDSVPMTIIAAQESVNTLQAFSWVFDHYPAVDERKYSSPVCTKFGIEQHLINCDHVWPQFDNDTHINPIFPFGIPYSEFQQETFRRAQKQGVTCLLTGIHGDLLYESTEAILYELIFAWRWREACQEFRRLASVSASKWHLIKHYFLKPLKLVQKLSWLKRRKAIYSSECLQDSIAGLIKPAQHWLSQESRRALRPKQWQVVLDGFAGEDAAYGRYMEAKYGIERRYPFRDRDLCEFMLAIPSDQLYFNLTTRPIVKRAFSNDFTDELKQRNDKTNFTPIISQGIERDLRCQDWFRVSPPHWSYFVKECYFESVGERNSGTHVIQWRCGYYNYWKSVCATI